MRFVGAVQTAFLLSALAPRLAAQRSAAQLTVAGGSATDVRGLSSSALLVAPSLTLTGNRTVARLGLSGTGFAGGGWALGGGAGLDLRLPLGRMAAITAGTSAGGIATSYHTSSLTLTALPALELRLAPITLYGGLRAATGRSSAGAVAAPAGPVALPTTRAVTRSAIGPVFGGWLALSSTRRGAIALGYRWECAQIDGLRATDHTATLTLTEATLALTATLGARSERAGSTTFGGARALVGISRILAIQLGAERYPADRLTGALGGRAVSAGIVLRTPSGPRPLPRPSGVSAPADGLTRLAIRAPEATTVEVAGDWNAWRPVLAHRGANGVWYADLAISAGTWRYAFRIDRRDWRVPDDATAVNDGFGGKSAWVTVGGK